MQLQPFTKCAACLTSGHAYPAHDARKESSAYGKVHKMLVKEGGCLICGVTNDVLKIKSSVKT